VQWRQLRTIVGALKMQEWKNQEYMYTTGVENEGLESRKKRKA